MNGLTRTIPVMLVGAMALLCTACSNAPAGSVPNRTEYSYTTAYEPLFTTSAGKPTGTAAADASVLSSAYERTGSFRTAVWLAKNRDTEAERYLVFLDETHGKVIEQQNGQETGFIYGHSEEATTFQFGAEEAKPVTLYWSDDDHAVIKWSAEQVESLTFLRENGREPLHFFTNEQLCAMALEHYAAQNGVRPAHARVFYNLDEMIAVQLYDGEGIATDTYDWYTVDRYTGVGYNTLNETVRLADNPAATAPAQTAPAQTTTIPATTAPPPTTVPPPASTVAQTLPALTTEVQPETVPEEPLPETTEDWGW